MKKLANRERGSIILILIITLPFLILISIYYMRLSLTSYQVARLDQLRTEAQLAADAGADYSIQQLTQDGDWAGAAETQLQNANNVRTTFTSSVTGDNNSKTIAVTGKTYWPASATEPERTVSLNVDLYPVTTNDFSLVSGAGGLTMNNSSKIVGGSVFVNGQIKLANSAQIGLSTKSVSVNVANQACPQPPDATYPRVCGSNEGDQPVVIEGNNSHIYGTVKATGQTNGNNMSNPGLVPNSTVEPKPLPTYDRAAQKAAVTNNMTGSNASCGSGQNITWPANTKITGNVIVSNGCVVTVEGNIWITGSLSLRNSSTRVVVANSLSGNAPNIMVDGQSGATFSNSSLLAPNSSGTGFKVYTFYSSSACSPDCTSVSGTALATSRTVPTITLQNSASAPNTLFYAYWSKVDMGNSGQIGAIIGQTIEMRNTAAITFGNTSTGISDTTWVVKGYRRQ